MGLRSGRYALGLVFLVALIVAGSTAHAASPPTASTAASSRASAPRRAGPPPPAAGRVSIYDGVLPSPELGPRTLPTLLQASVPAPAPAPVPAPAAAPAAAPTPAPLPATAAAAAIASPPAATAALPPVASQATAVPIPTSAGMHCGPGCIAGATLGGVALLVLLPLAAWLACRCCRRPACACPCTKDLGSDVMSTGDLDLLGHPVKPALEGRGVGSGALRVGDDVFLAEGRNCSFGRITAVLKDDSFQVATYTGESRAVAGAQLARNFAEGTRVLYTPPAAGKAQVTGTILQADGSYWPPFYQLTPDGGEVGLVNTTAQCLTELQEDGMVEVAIDARPL